jgi:hypothetical protein
MTNTALLNRVATEIVEPRVKPWTLAIRGWLPQHWVFTTETGSSTLIVEKDGTSGGLLDASSTPDVTIEWVDNSLNVALNVALTNGDRSAIPKEPRPKVTANTKKGADALKFLGNTFGL